MGPEQLQANLKNIQARRLEVEENLHRIDADLKRLTELLDHIKTKLAQRNMSKRTIADNLRYREGLREVLALGDEIAAKEKSISSVLPQVCLI